MGGFELTAAPQAGHVLTSDPEGVGTWQALHPAQGGWSLLGNAGTDPNINYLGTQDDLPLELRVNGERALRLEPDATGPNLIGGVYDNTVTTGVVGATIAGGGAVPDEHNNPRFNQVTDDYGTIGGGRNNQAGDDSGKHVSHASCRHTGITGGIDMDLTIRMGHNAPGPF